MSFADEIRQFKIKTELKAELSITRILSDIAAEVIYRTPIDTGRARGNWLLGINNRVSSFNYDSLDPSGNATYITLTRSIPFKPSGKVYWIINNTPYILELENGKSRQSPMGMVRLAKLRFAKIVRESVREH